MNVVYTLLVEARTPEQVDELDQMLDDVRDERRVSTVMAMGGEVVTS